MRSNLTNINNALSLLSVYVRVVVAIILRETKTRFGKNKLGYLWAVIEPSTYVAILVFIRQTMHASVPFGENLALFILTGVLVYRVFVSIAGRTMGSISSNQSLLTYPLVKPLDTIVSRIVLESLTMIFVLFVFFTLLSIFSYKRVINYPSVFIEAILALLLLSAGIGSLNAVLSILFPFWERIWGLVKFPILFLSGVFYVPKSMPPFVQGIIVWNPVMHCVDWLRSGAYLDYNPLLNKEYVIWFGLVTLALSLIIERYFRNKLVRT